MDNAWVIYDIKTLIPISVVWDEPSVPCIKIHGLLGSDFMLGSENLTHWNIKYLNGEMRLEKNLPEKHLLPSFWSLLSGDDNTNDLKISLIVDNDHIRVSSRNEGRIPAYLFATIKNDPAWLIKSWNLYDYNLHKGILILDLENAKNYSYYLDKIR